MKSCYFCQATIGLKATDSGRIATCLHDELEIIHIFNVHDKVIHISILDRDLPFFCQLKFDIQQYDICLVDINKVLHQANFPVTLEEIQQQFTRLNKLLPFL